ncbi:MAG: SH3 domain-containing protein [Candidatus Methylomirabilia bacterium]
MSGVRRCSRYRFSLYLVFLLVVPSILLSACGGITPWETAGQRAKRTELQERLATQTAVNQELKERVATFRLGLLEKEAQVKALREKLDEAIQELVRTKPEQPGLASKAEVASAMAETEIALKALRAGAAGQEKRPEVIQAEHLLNMSAEKFEKKDYGSALYLASQAKGLVNIGQMRLMSRGTIRTGGDEVLFAVALPLKVLATSNVRQGPGVDFKVVFTLEKGARLTGHSYQDQWVRVRDRDGRSGWIFHTLVGGREERQQ